MGASKEYYERIAPPKSFIHVSDFATPSALAALVTFNVSFNLQKIFFFFKNAIKMTESEHHVIFVGLLIKINMLCLKNRSKKIYFC